MHIFLICGYGIPKDIQRDQNYLTYLSIVFNHIYTLAVGQEAAIIPCGGATNCEPPYQGTEARAIADYLDQLMHREETVRQTSLWRVLPEEQSLSTLENLLFAKDILEAEHLTGAITIFCEKTREDRLRAFMTHLFPDTTTQVYAIDFDISKNRYLDTATIQKKEASSIQEGLWTLQAPDRIQKHHELFQRKFAFLRQRQSEGLSHVDAVKEWFEHEPEIIRSLMPDHPLFKDLEH
jgi:hypothetical protein